MARKFPPPTFPSRYYTSVTTENYDILNAS